MQLTGDTDAIIAFVPYWYRSALIGPHCPGENLPANRSILTPTLSLSSSLKSPNSLRSESGDRKSVIKQSSVNMAFSENDIKIV